MEFHKVTAINILFNIEKQIKYTENLYRHTVIVFYYMQHVVAIVSKRDRQKRSNAP